MNGNAGEVTRANRHEHVTWTNLASSLPSPIQYNLSINSSFPLLSPDQLLYSGSYLSIDIG